MPDEKKGDREITRAASVVGIGTLFSRVLGLFRDVVLARMLPASTSMDAFVVAFRIPNLLRRLFGEGALNAAFVPVFSEYLANRPKKDAFELARIVLTTLFLILAVISAAVLLFAPWLVRIQVAGWSGDALSTGADKIEVTTLLLRLMFPYVILICLTALAAAMLNTLKHFASGAFYPVLLNVSLIASALYFSRYFAEPVVALAVGVLVGGVLQLLLQVPPLVKRGFKYRPMLSFKHPGLRRIVLMMLPSMLAFGVVELNTYVDMLLASFLPAGSNTYLFFANRLVQLPLALFGIAVATPILPKLSKLFAQGRTSDFRNTYALGLRLIVFSTLPSTAGLIILRKPIINLLYERGAFTRETTNAVAFALLFYAIGIFAFAATKLAATAFYARKDMKTPVIVAAVALVSNVVLNLILMQFLAHGGLALASSISSFLNFGLLAFLAKRRAVVRMKTSDADAMLRGCFATAVMTLGCMVLYSLIGYNSAAPLSHRLLQLIGVIIGSVVIFVGACKLVRCKELSLFLSSFTRRQKP
ncbi:MAG: murein biosynthesis integral membrane protein MurJ [Candidatus Coatesbacteria bacterium]|nr:murein biosynthesis integral membrane protein MurJ [Candidatus Coatesbacteria bacterium]